MKIYFADTINIKGLGYHLLHPISHCLESYWELGGASDGLCNLVLGRDEVNDSDKSDVHIRQFPCPKGHS